MTPSIIVIHAHHMATKYPKKSTYSKWDSLLSSGFSNADEKFTWLDKPSFSSQKYKKLNTLQKYEIVRQTLIFIAKNINKLNALQTLIFQNIKKKTF